MTEIPAASHSQSKSPAPAKAGAGLFRYRAQLSRMPFLGFAALCLATAVTGAGFAYRDGPPPGFSGGFGEDHCQACHMSEKDNGINASPGRLAIAAPSRYAPGRTYTVTVTLARPGMSIGGFQLTARFEDDSTQAGTLAITAADSARIKVMTDRGVQYAHHREHGTRLTGPGTVRWTLRWTAPQERRNVVFNVAANAANADESQFGDFIYTTSARSSGR